MGIKRPAAKSGGSKAEVKRNMGRAARHWSEQPWTIPARMVKTHECMHEELVP